MSWFYDGQHRIGDIYNWQWLPLIKYIKMKEENTEFQYSPGEFVDHNGTNNVWVPKIIIRDEFISEDRFIKLKDPRHYLLAIDKVNTKSIKLQPFRTRSCLKPMAMTNFTGRWKKFDAEGLAKRQAEIQDYLDNFLQKSPKQIIQFLRGRHYFSIDELSYSQIQEASQYAAIMRYMATHRAFLVTYLRNISFRETGADIYATPMSALCSAFPEIMEFTAFAVGITPEFDSIKKETSYHQHSIWQEELTNWVLNEFFPAIVESKHEQFPPNLIFSLFFLLSSLFTRVITKKLPQLGEIYEMLYENLKRNLDQNFSARDLANFQNNCQSYFKLFRNHENAQSSNESSLTEQIDMKIELNQPEAPPKDNQRQILDKQELAKTKKMEFKLCLAANYYAKGEKDKFLREVYSMVQDVFSKISQNHYENQSQYPKFIKFFLSHVIQSQIPDEIIKLDLSAQETTLQRTIILRIFQFIPQRVLDLLVESEKLIIIKHLLQPSNRPVISLPEKCDLFEKIIKRSENSTNHKEYLQFFNYQEKLLKSLYTNYNLRPIREKLIKASFMMATHLQKPEHRSLVDIQFDFSDPLREQLWAKFTEQVILPDINKKYYYFYETSVQKYLNKFNVSLQTFEKICQFMKDPDLPQIQYEKRKASVIHALNFQYRHHRDKYPQYLSIFISSFCNSNHEKEEHDWVGFLPYVNDEKLPSFLSLPLTKQYCDRHLDMFGTLYYQLDIAIFSKLMLKLNSLNGCITLGRDDNIIRVNQFPDYLKELMANLYSNIETTRLRLIQKEVEKYFHGADNENIYNQMLIELLNTIIQNDAKRSQVNIIFKRLKSRFHLIPKSNTSSNSPKAQDKLICRNIGVNKRCTELLEKARQGHFYSPIYEEERSKINSQISFNRMELLKVVRVRIAYKLNRQPADVILYLDRKPLPDEKYNLSFQQVYYQQFYSQTKTKDCLLIEYQYASTLPPIRQELLDRIVQLFNNLPNMTSLLRGIDIFEENWGSFFSLQFLRKLFEGYLIRNQINEEEFRVTQKQDFLLDFYIWKFENKENYSFKPLIKFLRKIDSIESIMRNYKVAYLLNQSPIIGLSFDDCQLLLMSLLPDPVASKEKLEKNCQIFRSERSYSLLEDLVFKIIEGNCSNCLVFASTCDLYPQFTQYQDFAQSYNKLWTKAYVNSTIEQKVDFFRNFLPNLVLHPENMRDLYTIIPYEELISNIEFYRSVIYEMTSLLLRLQNENLTLKVLRAMEIIITNLSELSDESKIFHPILQSKAMVEFVKNYIYIISERAQAELINIIKIIICDSQNRNILLDFFEKQTRQKQWLNKPYLVRHLSRVFQLEGRVGLRNPHSVCYANSFLQQLCHIDIFRDQFLDTLYTQRQNPEEDLIYQLKKIFMHLHYGREAYFNPEFFKAFKNIDGEDTSIQVQMDVDEFRNLLLDRIQNAIPSNNNFVKRIFNGKQRSTIRSHQCQHQSKKEEEFSSLCVEVKGFENLQQSLNSYFKPEILSGDNAYLCDECKKKVTAEKIIQIVSFPPYLTFVLKRFQYVSYNRSKINSYFEFPLQTLQYFSGTKYRLKGVIVHMGISQAGHYISYAKHNDVWHEFNDCYVDEVDEQKFKESIFGSGSKVNGFSVSHTKNAYVLIYQAQNAPKKMERERTFYGIADQYKKVVKNRILTSKQKVYFSPNFLQVLNHIADRFSEPSSLQLLFWTLMTIHHRIRNQPVKNEILMRSWMILKKHKLQFKFLWSQSQIERVIQVFISQMNPEYKSLLVPIMVQNCQCYNEYVQKILEICLKKIYHEKADSSGYFMMMHAMARKFEQACIYLNSQRIVGRILDILLIGIIGQKVRQNLKKTCQVEFQLVPFTTKSFKESTMPYYKYHKWALLVLILERCKLSLHQIQKQHYVFHSTNLVFSTIFAQATDKPIIKFVSKYFAILCKENSQYFPKLLTYIADQLNHKEDCRKYMKAFKEIFFINDQHTYERNKLGAIIFQKYLKKLYEQKKETQFLSAWQWFLSIARTNSNFRKVIRDFKSVFQCFSNVNGHYLNLYRSKLYDGTYKNTPTKHPLYGIVSPTSMSEAQLIIKSKNSQMASILSNQATLHDPRDHDGDIIYQNFGEEEIILRYDENRLKFTKVAVYFSFGDIIVLRLLDKCEKMKQGGFSMAYRGDERLRLITETLPEILIIQPEKDDQEEKCSNSPRQI